MVSNRIIQQEAGAGHSRLSSLPSSLAGELLIRVRESRQLFVRVDNETLSIATMSVCNLASWRNGVTTPGKLA